MKVLHVISGGETGGSKNHVISLLSQFPKEDVILVCMQKGELYEDALKNNIDVRLLEQKSRYDVQAAKKLTQIIKEENADIVHSHGPRANLFAALIKRSFKRPLVTTMHSDPTLDFMKGGIKGKVFTKLNLWTYKRMDHFFAVSERFKSHLIQLGVHSIDITTIYNGIDFTPATKQRTLTRADLGLTEDELVISMVARLHPVKGHNYVFDALKQLNDPKVKVLLVGDGPYKQDLINQVNKLGLDDAVHFLGFRNDINELYQISDLGMLASLSESFPLALLEAAKEHTSVITTEVGGVDQLVPNPGYGWIVRPKNSNELAGAIEEAAEMKKTTPDELKAKGDRLYNHASEAFSLTQLAASYRDTYEQLMSNHR
ncbi:glycosyltransferase family 4 protein [Halobacillus locisalis]|uniref:Glycosyltransferase family 4 protein n=1 Tax=Halobacillus locisalis TaxID=220753 RepID=A0A838CU63_9BACI|nr:glycosyltransferase family 4 protein [Halobacillus locisalis]MBA2175315.1 glycosyltransferase family 4 protein [Halobacillus locisalis]